GRSCCTCIHPGVPHRDCDHFGEEASDETTTAELLLKTADAVGHVGVQVGSDRPEALRRARNRQARGVPGAKGAAVTAGSGDVPSRGRPSAGRGRSGRRPGLDVTCYDALGWLPRRAGHRNHGPAATGQLLFVARGARLLLWEERWDAGTHVEFAHFRVGSARLRPPGSFAVAETAFALGLR